MGLWVDHPYRANLGQNACFVVLSGAGWFVPLFLPVARSTQTAQQQKMSVRTRVPSVWMVQPYKYVAELRLLIKITVVKVGETPGARRRPSQASLESGEALGGLPSPSSFSWHIARQRSLTSSRDPARHSTSSATSNALAPKAAFKQFSGACHANRHPLCHLKPQGQRSQACRHAC